MVVAREDTPGDKRVVAYFVATPGAAPTTAELRSFMKEKLPEYMLPSVFVTLRSMPLTPNGKVDRRALPAPDKAELASTGTFAAPKDDLESRLVQIWESVLGVRPISVTDNYFELGGHSLVAVRLMKRIEEAFGKNLPIATLLQAPTIDQLAVILRQKGGAPAWSCLVPIQTGGSKPPFFCIHGINGAVVRFYDLSRYLGADQPFYGLQANGLEAGQVLHTRTEDMAAHYIKEIRRVQPQGPYFLGGYSFGGMIAFEMAQQLSTRGQEDAVVVLFDTNFPEPKPSFSQKAASTSSPVLTLFRIPASQRWAYLSRMVTVPVRMMQRWRHIARLPDYVRRVRTACLQAERDYRARAYPGRVILFRSSHKPLGQLTDPRAGWHKYAVRGLEICEILGNHENILLEPQVRSVAEQLKTCLEVTTQRSNSTPQCIPIGRGGSVTASGLQAPPVEPMAGEAAQPRSRHFFERILSFDRDRIKHKLIPWAMKGGLALLDQGVFAGSNFVISILLARWLSAAEYGTYAVGFAVFLFLLNFHQALLLEPMLVFGSSVYRNCLRGYVKALLLLHLGMSVSHSSGFVRLSRDCP